MAAEELPEKGEPSQRRGCQHFAAVWDGLPGNAASRRRGGGTELGLGPRTGSCAASSLFSTQTGVCDMAAEGHWPGVPTQAAFTFRPPCSAAKITTHCTQMMFTESGREPGQDQMFLPNLNLFIN